MYCNIAIILILNTFYYTKNVSIKITSRSYFFFYNIYKYTIYEFSLHNKHNVLLDII